MTMREAEAHIEELRTEASALCTARLEAPTPVSVQELKKTSREVAFKLIGIRPEIQKLLDDHEAICELVQSTTARRLLTLLPPSSAAISQLSKLSLEVFGPDTGNEWGMSQVQNSPFNNFANVQVPGGVDKVNQALFGGEPPPAMATHSFSAGKARAKRIFNALESLIKWVESVRQEVPTDYGLCKMIIGMEQTED